MTADFWETVKKLDMFTLNHISDIVVDLMVKQFHSHENKTPYSKGENYAYRVVMGELSRLIEDKKLMDKVDLNNDR